MEVIKIKVKANPQFLTGSTGGGSTTAANVGSGTGVYKNKVGDNLNFKSLSGSNGIFVTNDSNNVNFKLGGVIDEYTTLNVNDVSLMIAASGTSSTVNLKNTNTIFGTGNEIISSVDVGTTSIIEKVVNRLDNKTGQVSISNNVNLKSTNDNTNEYVAVNIDLNNFQIEDTRTGSTKGISYAADYSSKFTDNTLVNKKWVLSQVSGATGGISVGNFNFYSGTTAPNTYLTKSAFVVYSGATNTKINAKLASASFSTYTGTTAPNTYLKARYSERNITGTTYTLLETDLNYVLYALKVCTVTLPLSLSTRFNCTVVNYSSGNTTFISPGGTIKSVLPSILSMQNTAAVCIFNGSNTWTVLGALGTGTTTGSGSGVSVSNFNFYSGTTAPNTYLNKNNAAATSVIGRSVGTSGVLASITATTNNHVLRRSAGVLGFGTIPVTGSTTMNTARLLGRTTAAAGNVEEITPTAGVLSLTAGALTIAAAGVTSAMLRNSVGVSVIGRSANTTGVPADIAATTDNHVLRRAASVVGFGTIPVSGSTVMLGNGYLAGRLSAGIGGLERIKPNNGFTTNGFNLDLGGYLGNNPTSLFFTGTTYKFEIKPQYVNSNGNSTFSISQDSLILDSIKAIDVNNDSYNNITVDAVNKNITLLSGRQNSGGGSNVVTLKIALAGSVFTDTTTGSTKGIAYAADYSAKYSSRTLIDNGYATGKFQTITATSATYLPKSIFTTYTGTTAPATYVSKTPLIKSVGSSYSVSANDNQYILEVTGSTNSTLTFLSGQTSYAVTINNLMAANTVTVAAGGGTTLQLNGTTLTYQYDGASIYFTNNKIRGFGNLA